MRYLCRWWRRARSGINFPSDDVRPFNNKKPVRWQMTMMSVTFTHWPNCCNGWDLTICFLKMLFFDNLFSSKWSFSWICFLKSFSHLFPQNAFFWQFVFLKILFMKMCFLKMELFSCLEFVSSKWSFSQVLKWSWSSIRLSQAPLPFLSVCRWITWNDFKIHKLITHVFSWTHTHPPTHPSAKTIFIFLCIEKQNKLILPLAKPPPTQK